MTQYTYAQLEQLWINAGGSRSLAPLAAAIAEAESSGNSQATNPTDNNGTQTSWGLWQISNGTHGQPVPNILDPSVNAQQAVAKYRAAGGFSPWGTYATGAYKQYMNGSTTPDPNVPGGSAAPATLTAAAPDPACAFAVGGQHLGLVFGHGPSLPSACLLKKTEVRAMIGGLLLGIGGLVALPGVLILVAFSFKATGGLGKAADVAGAIPLPQAQLVSGGLRKAQGRASSGGSPIPARTRP